MFRNSLVAACIIIPALAFADTNRALPVPPSGFDVMQNSIPHGTVTASLNYPTRNHGNRKFSIYLPPGYSTATKYPVLYLLHGVGGSEVAWIGQGSNEGTAQHVMDYLYSKNLAKPMIIVMPMGNMTNTTGDTWLNFGDVLMNDLAPYIQTTYSAATDALNRAIAGLSQGAGQTLNFGPKNSTFFNWVGAFSPAPIAGQPAPNFPDVATTRTNLKLFWLSCGSNEPAYALTNCTNYHNFVTTNNFTQHMFQSEPGLGHEKTTWNRSLYNYAQRIFTGTTTGISDDAAPASGPARVALRMNQDGGTLRFSIFAPSGTVSLEVLRADGSRAAVLGSRPLASGLAEFSWDGRIAGATAPAGVYYAFIRRDGRKAESHRFVLSAQ
jgi:enterochelin esterase-like enzyme